MRVSFPHFWVFTLALIAVTPALPAAAAQAWKPYLDGGNGEAKELGDPRKLNDKEWREIRYTEYPGYRTLLGVIASEEQAAYPPKYKNDFAKMIVALSGKSQMVPKPQNYIEDLVRQALVSTNRFTLVERTTAAEDIALEYDLADSGRVDRNTSAKVGKIKGADFIVVATLIELNPEKEVKEITAAAGSTGAEHHGPAGFGNLGLKNKLAFCRLNVRVIRAETGEIVADQTVDGSATSNGVSGMGGVGLRMVGSALRVRSVKNAPIADAMEACANKAAYYVATRLEETAWQGTVATVTDGQLTITGGANAGLTEGMTLTLLSKGADVVDPETNEVIGSEASEIGEIKVVSVQARLSTCEILRGGEGAKMGDLVRREKPK
jgi:curli biogenesis system outer membrane secretion channel CsgG